PWWWWRDKKCLLYLQNGRSIYNQYTITTKKKNHDIICTTPTRFSLSFSLSLSPTHPTHTHPLYTLQHTHAPSTSSHPPLSSPLSLPLLLLFIFLSKNPRQVLLAHHLGPALPAQLLLDNA